MANQEIAPRLANWQIPRSRASDPAGYVRRYRPTLAHHDLGERTSICPSCHAIHFSSERTKGSTIAAPRFQTCCKEGQVVLQAIPDPPEILKRLWTSEDAESKRFRQNARKYNNAFAFTSFHYTPDNRLAQRGIRGGLRSFSIHGEIYHQIGTVAREGVPPKYAQLYYLDPSEANPHRVGPRRQDANGEWVNTTILDEGIVDELSRMIITHNRFYQFYRSARESLEVSQLEQEQNGTNLERRAIINANCELVIQEGADRRRENLPTAREFAVILPDVTEPERQEVLLFQRHADGSLSNRFQYIHRGHPAYLPLHYVLFYPFGNPGYKWNTPLRTRHRRVLGDAGNDEDPSANGSVSARQFYRFHIFSRQDPSTSTIRFNPLIHGERLFQQILCDMYACVDDNVLNWHRINQDTIRADLYRGAIDALRNDEPVRNMGQPIILASSYHGGDRHMTKCYQVRNSISIYEYLGVET